MSRSALGFPPIYNIPLTTAQAPIDCTDIPVWWYTCDHTTFSQYVLVSPKWAKEILETRNAKNPRVIREAHVVELQGQIDMGLLDASGRTVKFCWDGHLGDGQHILAAIVKSGRAVVMQMVFGCNPSIRKILDQLQDVRRAEQQIGASRLVGQSIRQIERLINPSSGTKLNGALLEQEMSRFSREIQFINEFFKEKKKHHSATLMGTLAFAYATAPNKVRDFTRRMHYFFEKHEYLPPTYGPPIYGESVPKEKDPMLVLAKYIINQKEEGKKEVNSLMFAKKIMRALYASLKNEPLSKLQRSREDGDNAIMDQAWAHFRKPHVS